MHILEDDSFYEVIKEYDRCVIDYFLIKDDSSYAGYADVL